MRYTEFVCPHCFHQLQECNCTHKPYELIHIDEELQEIIRILNCEKYYTTKYCCAGHYSEGSKGGDIYIVFTGKFLEPKGWEHKEQTDNYGFIKTTIRKNIYHCSKERFEELKAQALSDFKEFIKAIPENEEEDW